MLSVLILAIAITCVSCERNALGLSARTYEDSGQLARLNEDTSALDNPRRGFFSFFVGVVEVIDIAYSWWRTRTRSTGVEGERFKVIIKADPCLFQIYDANGDDAITRDELEAIFGDGEATHKLAMALDKSGDGQVDEEEFKEDMHKFVEGC
ncbi:hypothetical protein DPMN_194930 [Dreissena polymorpha]|uniref:EF-hand domain-containing protein n=1 Tax=Dreissena polymorpha TaxID=45954 RepID=A0A9D3Y5C7_DREPO|nr:hypothetical protein DPMN_194930 [Dreissena polymorpha]